MNEKYTKNETKFFNYVFGFENWDVPEELIEAASKKAKIQLLIEGTKNPGWTKRLDLLVRGHTRFIHEILFFSTKSEDTDKIVYFQFCRLIIFLTDIFENHYQQKMGEAYYQEFFKILFLSIYLSYNKAEYEKNISQSILSYGYNRGCSYHIMSEYINNIKNRHIRNFTKIQNSLENLSKSKQEIEMCFSRIKKSYETNTSVQKKQLGLVSIIGFSLFVIVTSVLLSSNIILASLTNLGSMFVGLIGILFLANTVNNRYAKREINSIVKKEYLEKFPEYYRAYKTLSLSREQREIFNQSLRDDIKQLDVINSNEISRVNLFRKWMRENPQKAIKFSIALQMCMIEHLTWQKTGVIEKIGDIREIKNKKNKLPICILSSGNSSDNDFHFSEGPMKKARKIYKKLNKSIVSEAFVEEPKNSHTKMLRSFLLTRAQKNRGILVLEYPGSPSKAFIRYGEHKAILTENLGQNLNNGILERGFVGKQGGFEGFKYLNNLKRYEYKPFDNLRIEYTKTEDKEEIADNEGNIHQVPAWEEVKNYKKS